MERGQGEGEMSSFRAEECIQLRMMTRKKTPHFPRFWGLLPYVPFLPKPFSKESTCASRGWKGTNCGRR